MRKQDTEKHASSWGEVDCDERKDRKKICWAKYMPPNKASNDRDEKEHILKDRKVKMEEKTQCRRRKVMEWKASTSEILCILNRQLLQIT